MAGCAFLFPGQASQFVGMAGDLCERYPAARELFAQADGLLGFDTIAFLQIGGFGIHVQNFHDVPVVGFDPYSRKLVLFFPDRSGKDRNRVRARFRKRGCKQARRAWFRHRRHYAISACRLSSRAPWR
mgnify:CR=1 FL=1